MIKCIFLISSTFIFFNVQAQRVKLNNCWSGTNVFMPVESKIKQALRENIATRDYLNIIINEDGVYFQGKQYPFHTHTNQRKLIGEINQFAKERLGSGSVVLGVHHSTPIEALSLVICMLEKTEFRIRDRSLYFF